MHTLLAQKGRYREFCLEEEAVKVIMITVACQYSSSGDFHNRYSTRKSHFRTSHSIKRLAGGQYFCGVDFCRRLQDPLSLPPKPPTPLLLFKQESFWKMRGGDEIPIGWWNIPIAELALWDAYSGMVRAFRLLMLDLMFGIVQHPSLGRERG